VRKDLIEVESPAVDLNDRGFGDVGVKPGDFSKIMQQVRQGVDLLLNWPDEDNSIISIRGSSDSCSIFGDLRKESRIGRQLEEALQRIDGKNKEER